MIDLARLEWSIEKVFDGPGVEHEPLLTVDDLLSIPQDSWAEARLLTVPCLMLLAFQFPVNDYYTAFRKDEDPPLPESAESYLALTRRDYIVRRYGLSGPQYRVLKSLVDGKTVGESIESIAGEFGNVEMLADRRSCCQNGDADTRYGRNHAEHHRQDDANPRPSPLT